MFKHSTSGELIILLGLIVYVDWLFHVDVVTSLFGAKAINMKPVIAIMFVLAGLGALSRRHQFRSVMGVAVLILTVLAQIPLLPYWLQLEEPAAGRAAAPSIGTAVAFCMLALSYISGWDWPRLVSLTLGLSCLIGYALGLPAMFFAYPEISNAMAVHTGGGVALLSLDSLNGLHANHRRERLKQRKVAQALRAEYARRSETIPR